MKSTAAKVGEKVGVNERKILQLVQKNPKITYKELSEKIGIAEKNVYTNLNKLKKAASLNALAGIKAGIGKR